jgi:hypothetical protein
MYQPTRTVRVVTHGRGAWDATVPELGLQSSAYSLPFANQTQGTISAPQRVTFSNYLQSGSLNLTGLQITGPFAQTNNCGASLAKGATCTVNVTFSPATPGNMQGNLMLSANTNNVTVGLSGIGLGIPQVALGGSSLAFGSQPLGVVSANKTVQLSNTGNAALANIAVAVSGTNAGDFTQTNDCGTTLAGGANCTIVATFNPVAQNVRSAALSISDNAAGSPQFVSLSGTGIAPFTVSATTTTSTVSAGSNATYQLAVASQGGALGTAVQLTCSGLPSLSTCTFSPATVPSGTTAQNITLTISTTPASSPQHASNRHAGTLALAALSLFGLLLLPRRCSWFWFLPFIVLILGLSGCGGGGVTSVANSNPGTPSGSYSITVTAAQSTIYQTTQALTLTVQQ